jgi:cell fate regulator YaaT (PSP1 superfamily)
MSCGTCTSGSGGCSTGGCSTGGCGSGAGCGIRTTADWLAHLTPPAQTFGLVEVAFKGTRSAFFRNTGGLHVVPGDVVVVECDRGIDAGHVRLTGEMARLRARAAGLSADDELPALIRCATPEEIERLAGQRDREHEAFSVFRERIEKLGLDMKAVDTEWQFDGRKVTFFFTASDRVDFRALVRELAAAFRTRVDLRQIGARDETARLGGIGACGRELCCATWLREFRPVTTGAARTQHLPLNPARLAGQCGRLKCCLNYELETYSAALKRFPRLGAAVQTDQGPGAVAKLDIFRDRVSVELDNGTWLDLPLAESLPLVTPRRVPRPEQE